MLSGRFVLVVIVTLLYVSERVELLCFNYSHYCNLRHYALKVSGYVGNGYVKSVMQLISIRNLQPIRQNRRIHGDKKILPTQLFYS